MADGAPEAETQVIGDASELDRLKVRSWDLNLEILRLQQQLTAVNDRIHALIQAGER